MVDNCGHVAKVLVNMYESPRPDHCESPPPMLMFPACNAHARSIEGFTSKTMLDMCHAGCEGCYDEKEGDSDDNDFDYVAWWSPSRNTLWCQRHFDQFVALHPEDDLRSAGLVVYRVGGPCSAAPENDPDPRDWATLLIFRIVWHGPEVELK